MGRKKRDYRNTPNWIVAICAIIAIVIELARFILDYIIR